jgi:hypothetical protein
VHGEKEKERERRRRRKRKRKGKGKGKEIGPTQHKKTKDKRQNTTMINKSL